jgi:hypothetical protein
MRPHFLYSVFALLILAAPLAARSQEAKVAGETITLAKGQLVLTTPATWRKKQPSVNMIEYESAVPAVEGDKNDGRLTIMAAGGSIEANIDRWIGQFTQPDGKSTKDLVKTEKITVDGVSVNLVDMSGTYKDQRGPFAPAAVYEDYRMLAAIIPTENAGRYFIKLYGPKKTIAANEEAFHKMSRGLDAK